MQPAVYIITEPVTTSPGLQLPRKLASQMYRDLSLPVPSLKSRSCKFVFIYLLKGTSFFRRYKIGNY